MIFLNLYHNDDERNDEKAPGEEKREDVSEQNSQEDRKEAGTSEAGIHWQKSLVNKSTLMKVVRRQLQLMYQDLSRRISKLSWKTTPCTLKENERTVLTIHF